VIVERSIDALKETILKAAQVMELTVNMHKTQYMELTKNQQILNC